MSKIDDIIKSGHHYATQLYYTYNKYAKDVALVLDITIDSDGNVYHEGVFEGQLNVGKTENVPYTTVREFENTLNGDPWEKIKIPYCITMQEYGQDEYGYPEVDDEIIITNEPYDAYRKQTYLLENDKKLKALTDDYHTLLVTASKKKLEVSITPETVSLVSKHPELLEMVNKLLVATGQDTIASDTDVQFNTTSDLKEDVTLMTKIREDASKNNKALDSEVLLDVQNRLVKYQSNYELLITRQGIHLPRLKEVNSHFPVSVLTEDYWYPSSPTLKHLLNSEPRYEGLTQKTLLADKQRALKIVFEEICPNIAQTCDELDINLENLKRSDLANLEFLIQKGSMIYTAVNHQEIMWASIDSNKNLSKDMIKLELEKLQEVI